MWKPKGNLRFPTRFQVVSIVETSSYTGLQGMETKRKLEVSNPIPSGFHCGNRAVSAFQTHGNHWFPLWKPGGNHMETPGFHVVSTRFPSCQSYPGYGTWTPNHFVFLSSKNDKHNVLNISDENEFPSLSVASNVPVTKSVPDTDITHFEFTEHAVATHSDTDMSHTEEHHTDTSQSDVHHTSHTEEHHTNMSHNEEHTDTSDTDNITQTDMHQDTHTNTCDESLVYIQEPYRNPNVNGLDGKFLSPDTLLNITLQDHADAPHTIPDGTKENVFFDINNTSNKQTNRAQTSKVFC
ncbi:hypothetical protein FSP39_006205 [Pinctada imbricata]|uniref:Uncharacterized protein n=1 Tax=Pinctada imbricata TaxID=66713 RepID=A0AA88YVT6_PINIB|nr:hypothetical protein FSP39_006205 [Pinctada imbricata]